MDSEAGGVFQVYPNFAAGCCRISATYTASILLPPMGSAADVKRIFATGGGENGSLRIVPPSVAQFWEPEKPGQTTTKTTMKTTTKLPEKFLQVNAPEAFESSYCPC